MSRKLLFLWFGMPASSEIQGQIVAARESLNGRKNKARRKVKNFEKSRLLYIMLAFFEHFSEAKALSIIRAF